MSDEDFENILRNAFVQEAAEQAQSMTSCLLELEKSPEPERRQELVEKIFREAHNLKGAAGSVDAINVQNLCQALESVFSEWKKGAFEVHPQFFDLLNRAVDLMNDLVEAGDAGASSGESPEVTETIRLLEEGGEAENPPRSGAKTRPRKTEDVSPAPVSGTPRPAGSRPDPANPPAPALKASETVRIPVSKMDGLLRQAEEMVSAKLILRQHSMELNALGELFFEWRKGAGRVARLTRVEAGGLDAKSISRLIAFLQWNQSYVEKIEKDVAKISRNASRDERAVASLVDSLLDDAKRLATLPVGSLFDLFPKMVRDISRELGKNVELVLEGREVEIDKRILQEMKDPLIHLVRNSIDHGLEESDVRAKLKKPGTGTLRISVTQCDGNQVEIVIADDGGGIDVEKLKTKAVGNGVLSPAEAEAMDDQSAFFLIFHSGVSTSELVTEISGRGLGMAIVREKVEKLGGNVAIESAPNEGTTFRIQLPVSLATFQAVLVGAGGQTFAIPTTSVDRIARYRLSDVKRVESRDTLLIDGHPVALVGMDAVLDLPPQEAEEPSEFEEVAVLGSSDHRIAFTVDSVINELELLVKPVGSPLVRVRNVAGAAILGSGEAVVILNTADLLKTAVLSAASRGGRRQPVPAGSASTKEQEKKILVADDSVTSRMLLKNILESAGYHVTTAIDGADALTALKSGRFDVLVSDVEMPRMGGFDLTAAIRADGKLSGLPVVLVTSLSSREDREKGVDVGASAYVVKSKFDQSNLLEIVGSLI